MFNNTILEVVDGLEPVVIERFGSYERIEIPNALRRKAKTQEQSRGNTLLPKKWCAWFLPISGDSQIEPRLGDEIVDSAANRWSIMKIEQSPIAGTRRYLGCGFEVNFGLDDFLDIYRKAETKDPDAITRIGWKLFLNGIPAKFSGMNLEADPVSLNTSHTRQKIKNSRNVILRGPLDIEISDRIRTSDGTFHFIGALSFPDRPNGWIELSIVRE